MELSKRLQAVAELVTKGNSVADVGCDHAYIPIWLVKHKISPHVIAMDINRGPLQRAAENIAGCGLTDYIETRLSDGLLALTAKDADALILAGMGGRLMLRILSDGWNQAVSMKEWILQPQSEISMVRSFLRRQGISVTQENIVEEDGKFYPMFRAAPTAACRKLSEQKEEERRICVAASDQYGGLLLEERHPVLQRLLEQEKKNYITILQNLEQIPEQRKEAGGRTEKRRQEVRRELEILEYARSFYS